MSQTSTNAESKRSVAISKALSYLLRHGAIKEKLNMDSQGYILVEDLLKNNRLKTHKTTLDDINHVVATNNKSRFNLKTEQGQLYICANQGHSIEIGDGNLVELTHDQVPRGLFHGTFSKNIDSIKAQGLKVMNRNHIHLTTNYDYIRKSCDTLIYIDVEKCLQDDIRFYESLNQVYLTRAIDGVLDAKYFKQIVKRPRSEP